jgi:serine/threonine protein kinase
MFQEEIKIHSSICHPKIVQSYFMIEDTSNYYIFMEYCESGNLYDYLLASPTKKLEENVVINYSHQILTGLTYLHSQYILHRDIKPENIYLQNGLIRIGDFGFAAKLPTASTKLFLMCGSPIYIAPEILANRGYSFPIDIWSFGITIFFLLTGTYPFIPEKSVDSMRDLIAKIQKGHYSYTRLRPSEDACDFIAKILCHESIRMTIKDALSHPFITKYYPNDSESNTSKSSDHINDRYQIDGLTFEIFSVDDK